MNGERINALMHDIPDNALRAEVREFAMRPQDEQLVQLYIAMKGQKASKSLRDRLFEYGYVGSLIAYVLFDNKDQIPPLGGR